MPTTDEVKSSLEAEVMAVTLDDQDAEPTAPVEETEGETPPSVPETPADSEAPQEPDAQAPAEPEVPKPWQPPDGGQPLALRADGKEFPIDGALRWDHGVYIPNDSWPQVQRYLADREGLNSRYQSLQKQYEARDPEQHPRVKTADAYMQWLDQQLAKPPEEVAEWLDNLRMNKPLLDAQIKAQILEAQLQSKSTEVSDVERDQQARAIGEQLPGYLRQHIDYAIQHTPELKDLTGQTDAVFQELWTDADYLLVEATTGDMPEYGLKQGQIGVHPDRFQRRLKHIAHNRAETKRLQEAATLNAKATAKLTPPVTTRGTPTPGKPVKHYASGDHSWKDDVMDDALEE